MGSVTLVVLDLLGYRQDLVSVLSKTKPTCRRSIAFLYVIM